MLTATKRSHEKAMCQILLKKFLGAPLLSVTPEPPAGGDPKQVILSSCCAAQGGARGSWWGGRCFESENREN